MAAITQGAFLENGGYSWTADIQRRVTKAERGQQGVVKTADLAVAQNGTPNMSVNVAAGDCVVDGTQDAIHQGSYEGTNDATTNLGIAAADATNPRIDIVVAQFEDSVYSGANNDFKLAVVTGTPAPSPTAPATPANAMVLAQVAVAALAASIVNANITDKRTWVWGAVFPGLAGHVVWDSTGTLANLTVAEGGTVSLRGPLSVPTAVGGTPAASSYGQVPVKFAETLLGGSAATVSFTSIPATFRTLKAQHYLRTDVAVVNDVINVRLNNDAAANYNTERQLVSGTTTVVPVQVLGANAIYAGFGAGASGTAAFFGAGEATVVHYAGTTGDKVLSWSSSVGGDSATGDQLTGIGMGVWKTTATAVNRFDYVPGAGNIVAGSYFKIQLEP